MAAESSARGHGSPPLIVVQQDPIADHPALGPMYKKRGRVVVKKVAGTKARVKVDVKIGGNDGETE